MAPPPATMAQRIDALLAHATIVKPDGEGPFKTVLLLHGCGGRKPFMDRWADVVRDAGCAAIVVDSHAPRRISRAEAYALICTGLKFWGRERAGDLYAMLAWARAQSWAGPLIAAGWSHGAWTILDALVLDPQGEAQRATGLSDLPANPLAGLEAAFLAYPYLGRASLAHRHAWQARPRTLAIAAGRDAIVGKTLPQLQALAALGLPIETHFFETATHAFDEGDANDPRVRYDAALTARAHSLMRDLLASI